MQLRVPSAQIMAGISLVTALSFFHYANSQDFEDEFDTDLLDAIDILHDEELDLDDPGDFEWLVAPIPSRSAGLGWTLAVPAGLLYRPQSADGEGPAWISAIGGFYAENGSWGTSLFHRMNLKDDRWRVMGTLFYGDLNYNVYGTRDTGGNPNWYFELGQKAYGGMVEGLRKIAPDLYFGLRTFIIGTEIHSIRFPKTDYEEIDLSLFGIKMNLNSLVPRFVYDTRDNEFYPQDGSLAHVQAKLDSENWGSDFEYQIYSADWNQYIGLTDNQVLALRVAGEYASGDVPFFLLPAMGKGSDLRGFQPGIYRDNILLTGQMEYRHRLSKRIGVVAFYGLGNIGSEWDDLGETLYSGGVGLRWVLAPENNISFRLDVAWGQDDPEYYISLGEAF